MYQNTPSGLQIFLSERQDKNTAVIKIEMMNNFYTLIIGPKN